MAHAYDGCGGRSPQWWPSRYGEGDTLGAGNELTPERTLEALKIPRDGRVVELAQVLQPDVPAFPPRMFYQHILGHGALDATLISVDGTQVSYFEEQVSQTYHIGCHVDGLGHVGIDGHFYNGVHYKDFFTPTGLTRYGMEQVRPWVARGVCLDIAAVEGVAMLPEGFQITPEHLEAAEKAQGVQVRAGDVALVHTGWSNLWLRDDAYGKGEPGCTWEAGHWLTERRVSMVGADNWAFECIPFQKPEWPFVVHQHLLAETGTYILENIRTQELADGGHSEFLFLFAPNKVVGATGSMAAPLAVV
jgi:kynurenine formamidase